MCVFRKKLTWAAVLLLAGAGGLGGCAYYSPTPVVAQTEQTGQRVYAYPNGQYELRGNGTTTSPYYWVWIPTGAQTGVNPPPPPLPSASNAVLGPAPDQRVHAYSNGRYELHGNGTASSPFFWVWIPTTNGSSVSIPPPPPVPPES